MKAILHIDMNSFFASVEQQANPRLRGKPIGVTGGDRLKRTVLGAASIEAKKFGVKTGMQIWEAKKICPKIIIVKGHQDKYLAVTTKFINILKDFSPDVEVFSIDEAFLEIESSGQSLESRKNSLDSRLLTLVTLAQEIKQCLKNELGFFITCSIGISYNKLMAKLAGSLKKPDGLVVIPNQEEAIKVLDLVELDEICGIGFRIKQKLFNMGIRDFKALRKVPKECLLASFKSYGEILYNMARGIDYSQVLPFYDKEEVKSVGHRHTLDHDTCYPEEIRQILLKLCELIAGRLRQKNLVGKTIHLEYRSAFTVHPRCGGTDLHIGGVFEGGGMQASLGNFTNNGMDIFQTSWKIFNQIWDQGKVRMIGASISNLKPTKPKNLFCLPEFQREEKITETMDKINQKFGNFTLQRAALLTCVPMSRKPNSFLSDRRFKL
ncbi:MAG: DNA polymerase IV [Candidatus Daviesbacteria bacterium]